MIWSLNLIINLLKLKTTAPWKTVSRKLEDKSHNGENISKRQLIKGVFQNIQIIYKNQHQKTPK